MSTILLTTVRGKVTTMKTIYMAEDDVDTRELYTIALEGKYTLRSFAHAEGALGAFDHRHPDLLLTDHNMGKGLTGHDLIAHVRERGYGGHVLMVSGSIPIGATYRTLDKPVTMEELRSTIDSFFQ